MKLLKGIALLHVIIFVTISVALHGQIMFDEQIEDISQPVPEDFFKHILKLDIYNSSEKTIYKSVENKLGVSCGNVTKDRLVLGNSKNIIEVEDRVRWYSSLDKRWLYDLDPKGFWAGANQWIDNDTLQWLKIFKLEPNTLDSINLICYYKINTTDSIAVGNIKIGVKEIPVPKLEISEMNFVNRKIEKQKLISLGKLNVNMEMDHPDKGRYSNIISFEMEIIRGKKYKTYKCYGDFLTVEMKRAIRNSKKKTKILFKNIRSELHVFEDVSFVIKK